MQHWNVKELTTPDGSRSPEILHSQVGESRVVAIHLQAGQELGDHQVTEAALLLVVSGEALIECGGEAMRAVAGDLFRFDPNERHAISTEGGVRVLLTLAPWPGDGHYRGNAPAAGATAS